MNSDSENENYIRITRHTNSFKDPPPINACRHKSYGMFFKCLPKEDGIFQGSTQPHYHCISCGRVLADDIVLRCALRTAKIFKYRYSCARLCDHLQ
jgi:hypothetical protein